LINADNYSASSIAGSAWERERKREKWSAKNFPGGRYGGAAGGCRRKSQSKFVPGWETIFTWIL